VAIGADVISLVGGAAAGSALTGWFAISQKAKARIQRRRSEVYVDMLAWIGVRITLMAGEEHPIGMVYPNDNPSHNKKTDPHPESTRAPADTDPGTPFFVALRARIVAFGSHDMTRAFDRWTAQYLVWNRTAAGPEKVAAAHDVLRRLPDDPAAPVWARLDTRPGLRHPWAWCKRLVWDPGRPFPTLPEVPSTPATQGRLTRPIEYCASKELRKG
jgi:hypothetical protein